jgi:hypothetical protein
MAMGETTHVQWRLDINDQEGQLHLQITARRYEEMGRGLILSVLTVMMGML